MGILAGFSGFAIYALINGLHGHKKNRSFWYSGIFVAAWVGVVAGAVACAVVLGVSAALNPEYGVPFIIALRAMAITHTVIGIGEGLITVLVIAFIEAVRPDIISLKENASLERASMPAASN